MRVNLINGNIWPPEKWSVFNQHVRTNNDAEGWQHNRINERERAKLNFYELVKNVSEVYENCNKLNADAECLDDEKDDFTD
jgi:hypothetical protein